MQLRTRVIGAAGIAAVVAAGGSAFTNSNTMPAGIVHGYGTQSATGEDVKSISYGTNTAGSTITTVDLVLVNDTTLDTVSLGFNDGAPVTCTGSAEAVFDADALGTPPKPHTSYICTVSQATSDFLKLAVVTNKDSGALRTTTWAGPS